MSLSMKIWLPLSLVYILFFLWYTNLSGPLSEQEIAAYKKMFDERIQQEETLGNGKEHLSS